MTALNYTLTNYGSTTATILAIEFDPNNGINHTANLSNFGGYLAGETAYTGNSTYPTETATVTDFDIIREPTYVAHFTTGTTRYLVVSTTEGIKAGFGISLNGYTGSQGVVSVTSATWLVVNGNPAFPPTVGQAVRFTPPDIYLYVDDVTGIRINDQATGNGYDGSQTVVAKNNGLNRLTMSDYPSSTPVVGGQVSFTDVSPIGTIAPGQSIPFTIDYLNVTTTLGEYQRDVRIYAQEGSPVTKTINNFITLSTAPAAAPPDTVYATYYDGGGGAGGDASSAACSDSSSASCSAASAAAGGGGCFTAETLINLKGGITKPISQIQIGDMVIDALTGRPNEVIGVKVTQNPPGRKIFATRKGEKPYITEEHPFYNDKLELCAMSELAEHLAPWLGSIKIVDVPEIITPEEPVVVYNLILKGGNTHYANGLPVNNIIGHGSIFPLLSKGLITEEDYYGYIYNLDNADSLNTFTQEQKARLFKFVAGFSKYVLENDNLRSRILAKLMAWGIKNRAKVHPYLAKWFHSRLRKFIIRPKK